MPAATLYLSLASVSVICEHSQDRTTRTLLLGGSIKIARCGALLLAIAFCIVASSEAQNVERVEISIAEVSFSEPFSSINGLREMSDGRLIISDRTEQVVRFVDLDTGDHQDIGRAGEGPGEYRMPGDLLPLPGDSTLLSDLGNMRMSVISPNGRIVRSFPLMRSDGLFVRPSATDALGRLYFLNSVVFARGSSSGTLEMPDSMPVSRWDLNSDVIDTLCYLNQSSSNTRTASRIRLGGGGAAASFRGLGPSPFAARDAWGVAPDGRVGLAYASDYHVEWAGADGSRVKGEPVDYRPIRIFDDDKEEWADRRQGGVGMMITSGGSGGGGSRTMRMPRPDTDDLDWPEVKPPFPSDGLKMTPEGELWIGRHMRAGEAQAFDVFDESGRRVREVVLPAGRRLVGFGNGKLYLAYADEDDLQWLERYAR